MTHSESINELAGALAKAQGQIEGAIKGKENPHFRSRYADLGAVWDACREHLSKNGIAVVQSTVQTPEATAVSDLCTVTRLVHSSGQWMQDGGIPLILSKQDMQGLGSALTYSRRYGLMAMVGIAPEDDDGNAAVAKNGSQPTVSAAPAGYENWFLDLAAVAEEGVEPLKKAWSKSKVEFRSYLTSTNPKAWEQMKAKAAEITAETVPA